MTVGLSAPFTQSYSLLHKNTEIMMCRDNDQSIMMVIFLPFHIPPSDVVCEIYHIWCVCVYSHMPTCECCVFEDTGVCVGVGPSMSTRGILGKGILKDFIQPK